MRFWIADFGLRIWLGATCAFVSGCINSRPSTQPSTNIDLATTQPSFWLEQQANAQANSNDFDALWNACQEVARAYFFKLDRLDYRQGVITTVPMASAQFFEPWRRDTPTMYDSEESSLATIRRSIRFEITREGEGWKVVPKVLVERQSIQEHRITSVTLYRTVFANRTAARGGSVGSREEDQGIDLPQRYWYPLRRDVDFERAIASAVQGKLGHK